MKKLKIIKAHFDQPAPVKPPLPKVNDLVLNFASDTTVYTITVKASEMGKMAKAFIALMVDCDIDYSFEEKPR